MISLPAFALALFWIAAADDHGSSVKAASNPSVEIETYRVQSDSGGSWQWSDVLGAIARGSMANCLVSFGGRDAENVQQVSPGSAVEVEAFWSATLMVGRASDSNATYMEYSSNPERVCDKRREPKISRQLRYYSLLHKLGDALTLTLSQREREYVTRTLRKSRQVVSGAIRTAKTQGRRRS